ncbi:MMPL family transporter [Solirubrobacter sp. CPCC 204708]|uniref:MMPL family transporter n=1 Tax=Solirubrobacter deserti TaxID=2282478 RepID=A0ABT4RK45_9ACTN|nr:MMPL family transporter [Solirubrobacter deserti]MBE2317689.1 MMPL family transporter [Solirubrobacter deserti]MDA0138640.1 MMPL family transporter [Solirubrobacter deserti]
MPRWAVIGAWLLLALAMVPLQGPLQTRAADESDTFLARGSESAGAKRVIDERFRAGSESVAVIAYLREGGITSADRQRIVDDGARICSAGTIPSLKLVGSAYGLSCGDEDPLDLSPGGPGLLTSSDASVALASVALTDDSTPVAELAVKTIRDIVPPPAGDETGLRAWVTGEVGFEADRSEAVKTIDETLLIVTCVVLIVLLLLIYRSPLMALVPIFVVGVAYIIAGGLTYLLVRAGVTTASGQSTAILIVLMFGAGTDYCLLLVARYRDELRRTADPDEAIRRASERTAPAILSAGAIVIAAMLVLVLADFNATREMGPILALGIAVMVVAGLTLLPALLGALGRRAFWPAVPRVEATPRPVAPLWAKVGRLVDRRPGIIAAAVTLLLLAGALGAVGGREPMDFSEAFRTPPESVGGEQIISERFIPGRAAPVEFVMDYDDREAVIARLTEGMATPIEEMYLSAASVPTNGQDSELAVAQAYLKMDPFSDAATDSIPELRRAANAAASGSVLLGGEVPEAYDTRQAMARDTWLILPIGLALILLILGVLLRAVVMPLYVIATVILSFGFALGVSSLVFTHVMGQPASDRTLEQFAFIFLVALGVDYNVFLLARIREERARAGTTTRQAVITALERTGGVITSAGLVLAATFSVLMALPLESLFQVGFVVALGLLVDTFLVRALLVPSVAVILGERNWWPSKMST